MASYLLLAVRPPAEGKSRLGGALSEGDRISLNYSMFRHVFSVVSEVFPPSHIIVVSRSPELLEEVRAYGADPLIETGSGLNAALEQGARHAIARGAEALAAISSDLPSLTAEDVRALIEAPVPVAIATDRLHQGTNALAMRPPGAIPFRFGVDSLAAHLEAARGAGLQAQVIERPGLARDIDTPADLAEFRAS